MSQLKLAPALTLGRFDLNQSGGIGLPVLMVGNRKPQGEKVMAEDAPASKRMKRKLYEKELRKLQVELCHLQQWVKAKNLRAIILFEGRDTPGKGGTIKRITGTGSPRTFRVVPLSPHSDREIAWITSR